MQVMKEFDAKEIANHVTIELKIKVKNLQQWRVRLWIAEKLIWLGCAIGWINFCIKATDIENEMVKLGNSGIVTSICYGSMAGRGLSWSVDCLYDKTKESFNRPYVANSLEHCIEIANIEAKKRGWILDDCE